MFKLLIALLLCATGCVRVIDATGSDKAVPASALSDEIQLRVLICEAVVTNALKSSGGPLVFVALGKNELEQLAARIPKYKIRSSTFSKFDAGLVQYVDAATEEPGVLVTPGEFQIEANRATARGLLLGTGTRISYRVDLARKNNWIVTNTWREIISDVRPKTNTR